MVGRLLRVSAYEFFIYIFLIRIFSDVILKANQIKVLAVGPAVAILAFYLASGLSYCAISLKVQILSHFPLRGMSRVRFLLLKYGWTKEFYPRGGNPALLSDLLSEIELELAEEMRVLNTSDGRKLSIWQPRLPY